MHNCAPNVRMCKHTILCICTYIHVFPVSSSVTDARVTLDTPNENKLLHSITVICIIQRDNAADLCEVRATTNGETLTGTYVITKTWFVLLNT